MNPTLKCLRLIMPLMANSMPLLEILDFGLSVAEFVKRSGGRARCFKTANAIVVEQTWVSRDQLDEMVTCFATSFANSRERLSIIVEEREAPEISLDLEGIIRGEYARPKLTQKLILSLSDGAILVGNTINDGRPNFAAVLKQGRDRDRLWKEAVRRKAAQRICFIFWDPDDVRKIHGIDLNSWQNSEGSYDLEPFDRS